MAGKPNNRIDPLWPKPAATAAGAPPASAQELVDKLHPLAKKLESLMGQHPRTTLTVAGTLGVVLGWIVKRK